jgi:hypothetical protein
MSTSNMVGMSISAVNKDYGATLNNGPQFAAGTIAPGRDGHTYIYAKATGAVASNAVCILTEPALTMATGAGAWTNKTGSALVANDWAWFQKTAA